MQRFFGKTVSFFMPADTLGFTISLSDDIMLYYLDSGYAEGYLCGRQLKELFRSASRMLGGFFIPRPD